MNVSTKRLLSILLSLAMLLAMLPLSVFAADAPTTLYVKPNSNWNIDNARFAAYFFGNGETWVDCTLVADGIYEVAVPEGYPSVIFCRMNPNKAANNWNNKWNQTSDLKVPTDGTNCYIVADGSWDNGKGQWTTYTPDGGVGETETTTKSPIEFSVAGDATLCGTGWTPEDINNMMLDEDKDGIYTITYTEVAAGSYEFKVTDGTWSNSWGKDGGESNYVLTLLALANVTINFNSADHSIEVVTEYLEELPSTEPTEPAPVVYYVAGSFNGWNSADEAYKLIANEDGTYSLTFAVTADSYALKVTDGTWDNSWGGLGVDGNYEFTAETDGEVTVTFDGTTVMVSGDCLKVEEPTEPAPKEYCLVGFINGANYGCDEDWENVGEYIFVDGTLTTSFAADSYIFVKTTDSANWYLAEVYCTETTCTFTTAGQEKMFVPGNVELTFTLTENEDGSITVSYETGAEIPTVPSEPSEPEAPAAYYVTGDFAEWNPADEAFLMNVNEDGTYSLTFAVTAGKHALKVTNGTWDSSWGGLGEGGNYEINAVTDGEITVTFDGTTVLVSGDCLGEIEAEPLNITSIHVAGSAGLTGVEWDPTANKMDCADGVYTITFTGVAAGTYEYKFVANGTGDWDINWASGLETVSGETYTAYYKAMGNSSVVIANDDSTVTLTFDTTTMDAVTGEGATLSVLVESTNEEPSEPSEPTEPAAKEYCLVGFINGANYGCEEDWENVGEYIFVDGTLSTSFTADSYIFVKTTDSANWYLAEAYCTETTCTFTTAGQEKMFVPGNVELTFTLTENEDGSITVSYVTGAEIPTEPTEPTEPEAPATYYVTGDFAEWNPADEAFLMNVNEDGTYSLTFAVTAGKHALKVTNGTWDQSWGGLGEGGNYEINATTDGEITVTFDGTTVMVSGDCLGEFVQDPLDITSIHVAGSAGLTGVEWDPTANKMDCADGVYTITFTGVAAGTYEYKFVANGTGDWDINWASGLETVSGETYTAYYKAMGNSSVVIAEDNSTVTLTFNTTTMDAVTGEGATLSVLVEAPVVEPSVIPTLTAKYPTVSFEDVIILNIYFDAKNTQDVKDMGLLLFPEKYDAADISLAEEVLPGYVWNEGAKLYTASTNGIPAKELGKTIYFAVYAELADGTYAYSKLSSYSVEKYAKTQLTSASTTAEMKALMVATLNYAAAAQVRFNYNADTLVNASLTEADQALNIPYSADMITVADKPEGAKLGDMVKTGNYKKFYPTVSFEGAFSINYYFQPTTAPVGDITMYVWTQADYEATESLSKENASYALTMELLENGEYRAIVENIAAKQLNDALYVSICYNDGTTDYCSGVTGYSIGLYCKAQAAKTGAMAELAKATAVYGYYAKQRFG